MHVAALFLALPVLARAAPTTPSKVPEGGGIVYGKELGVVVSAPDGWIFDAESGVDQGLSAVMYPTGSTWADAVSVMYVNVSQLKPGETLADFIEGDVASFKEKSATLEVKTAEPVSLEGGAKAEVRLYSGDAWNNYEAVAYASQGNSVAIFVLSCRTAEAFAKSVPAFRHMVAGSSLVGVVFKK